MRVIRDTTIHGCKHILPDVFYDFRGEYVETWNKSEYREVLPVGTEFVQDDFSLSERYTLRGFHGDTKTHKLIQSKIGSIIVWVIDIRKDSPTYGVNESFCINEKNRQQVFVPAGCALAHLCLSAYCMFDYKQTEYYDRAFQFSYNYKSNGVDWPIADENLILSRRDRVAPLWIKE